MVMFTVTFERKINGSRPDTVRVVVAFTTEYNTQVSYSGEFPSMVEAIKYAERTMAAEASWAK